jgi:hypothetical protein
MRPTHLIVALAPNLAQTGCGNTPGGSGATSAGSPAGNGPYKQFARALESRADCPRLFELRNAANESDGDHCVRTI